MDRHSSTENVPPEHNENGEYLGQRLPSVEDKPFYVGKKRFVIKGGLPSQQEDVERFVRELMATELGRTRMLPALEARRHLRIFEVDFIIDMRFTRNRAVVSDLNADKISIDPYYRPPLQTTAGRIYASFRRCLWHEFGHAALGIDDADYMGKPRMANVIQVENVLMMGLGEPARIAY